MKNPPDAIEKVFAGLRSTEPPAGMNHRIIAALDARGAASQPRRAAIMPNLCGTAAFAVALAAVFVLSSIHRRPHISANAHLNAAPAVQPAQLPPAVAPVITGTTQPVARHSAAGPIAAAAALATTPGDMDAIALEETRAPSQPPPPAPLTEQEKLLLRMVYNRNPMQLAALSPAARARDDAKEEADFQKFFAPPEQPKTGDTE